MTFSLCFITLIITSLFRVISTRSFQNRAQLISTSILIPKLNFSMQNRENGFPRNYRMRTFRNMRKKWSDRILIVIFVISVVENSQRQKNQHKIRRLTSWVPPFSIKKNSIFTNNVSYINKYPNYYVQY